MLYYKGTSTQFVCVIIDLSVSQFISRQAVVRRHSQRIYLVVGGEKSMEKTLAASFVANIQLCLLYASQQFNSMLNCY